jgi:hypothetical protein
MQEGVMTIGWLLTVSFVALAMMTAYAAATVRFAPTEHA